MFNASQSILGVGLRVSPPLSPMYHNLFLKQVFFMGLWDSIFGFIEEKGGRHTNHYTNISWLLIGEYY